MIFHRDRDDSQLKYITHPDRRRGRKIITTNGVFDILHMGHIRLLEYCWALGDILIVGVNSDASVQKLNKGIGRPFQDEESRAVILHSIGYVNDVVVFDEETPCETLKIIRPDIHVKGGDYNIEEMPETPVVRKYGGKVVLAPIIEGYSSTKIINDIVYAFCPMVDGCPVRHTPFPT